MPNDDDKPFKTTNLIQTVVAHMMTPGVVQVPGDVSVSEAALLLAREQAPCLLVKDTDMQFGLMTATDIMKKVVAQGEHLIFRRFHEEELLHIPQLVGHLGCEIIGLRVVLGDVIQFPFVAVDHVRHFGHGRQPRRYSRGRGSHPAIW